MKNKSRIFILIAIFAILATNSLHAERLKGEKRASSPKDEASCLPATNSNELVMNNVSAFIRTNGTMWNREVSLYEVPKGSGKKSMFAAALWIGGRDVSQQLKLAAVRFNQVGEDFWTGPLSLVDATITPEQCREWDRHFRMTRREVEDHIAAFDDQGNMDPEYVIPNSIRDWPAHPKEGHAALVSYYLAPFKDVDGDGVYDPTKGDYPYYDLTNELCPWTPENIHKAAVDSLPHTPEDPDGRMGMIYADHVLKGDETLFWIFNDNGGPHTESRGQPIGLEIRGQAFAFATNDELNNMTFYSYEIINRSTYELTQTYFSQWVDPDLGYAYDDFVGCDVLRGLGYCYNGTAVDGQGEIWAYGDQPPAVGVDFFQGPYMDADGRDNPKFFVDSMRLIGEEVYCNRYLNSDFPLDQMAINGVNFGDGIVDNERFGMRRFVYHNNNSSNNGDPSRANDYYNMLQGIWKDNTRMQFGGDAYRTNTVGPDCDFMFPGTTDPCNWGTQGVKPQYNKEGGWTEENENNSPFDRRFMQSAGPFTLKAGAVNYITVGIPWARAVSGGPYASVEQLKRADDKCQSLFENCFKVLDGPDAPDMTIKELENQLVLLLTNEGNNNVNESYAEEDNQISEYSEIPGQEDVKNDRFYRFEGYMIYQLASADVSVSDLNDLNKARLVRQVDIENYRENGNPIGKLVNYEYDDVVQAPVPREMVNGANQGISHSFLITDDAFARGTTQLVNHKTYYFMVIAYAYNEFAPYSVNMGAIGLLGQQRPFLAGRKNIQVYSGIPHKPAPLNEGTILNSAYGTQPMITRVEGQGNGGFYLNMTKESRDRIMSGGDNSTWTIGEIKYERNAGPIGVKVIDPLSVLPYDYEVRLLDQADRDVTDTTTWELRILDPLAPATLEELGFIQDLEDGEYKIKSDMVISRNNEQLIPEIGLALNIKNYPFQIRDASLRDFIEKRAAVPGYNYTNMTMYGQVDFLGSSITFADTTRPWLSGVTDQQGDRASNWIRSGQQIAGNWNFSEGGGAKPVNEDYSRWKTEDFFTIYRDTSGRDTNGLPFVGPVRGWKDPLRQFDKAIQGRWSPYVLASPYYGGPQAKYVTPDLINSESQPQIAYYDFRTLTTNNLDNPGYNQTLTNLYSVDIVLTPDKDKWTRCIVLEAGDNRSNNIGGAFRHEPRKSPSVDKNGNPESGSTGMGWFPGYAINVETGERLNIMFSEDSSDPENNGANMIFDPTETFAYLNLADTSYALTEAEYNMYAESYPNDAFTFSYGGRHFVYVCGSSGNTAATYYREAGRERNFNDNERIARNGQDGGRIAGNQPYYECGPYDEGRWLMDKFNTFVGQTPDRAIYRKKMQLFNNVMWTSIPMPAARQENNWLSNDVTIKLRVSRPYLRYDSRWYESSSEAPGNQTAINGGYPVFRFSTKDLAPVTNATSIHEDVLAEINIVPNPYYGFSTYESTALETYVKIVNLPRTCDIHIYTVNGILVKKFHKNSDGITYVDWDLKNDAGIPIAGGMYLVHVDAPNIGKRTLKFFCAMRPADLNAF